MKITEKVVLGTVQFGVDYGIANTSGRPSRKEVFQILDLAWDKGVRSFDTAPGYGTEELLGEFIKKNGIQNEVRILTKIPPIIGLKNFSQTVQKNIESSLQSLGCSIEVLFFHKASDSKLLIDNPGFFQKILNHYPISSIGVSVYDPKEVELLANTQFELAFQFPFNVLDRRFEKVIVKEGKRYARSIFLQGLLTQNGCLRDNAPKELVRLNNNYHSKLSQYNLNPVKFSISFVYNARIADYFILGVDNLKQCAEILNMQLYDRERLNVSDSMSNGIDENWLNPRNWN